ncbi:MAG: hypothetical protein R2734_08985 [Nocardioides sp.]
MGYRYGNPTLNTAEPGPLRVFDYDYRGAPAWRHVNSRNLPDSEETWSDWRGMRRSTSVPATPRVRMLPPVMSRSAGWCVSGDERLQDRQLRRPLQRARGHRRVRQRRGRPP